MDTLFGKVLNLDFMSALSQLHKKGFVVINTGDCSGGLLNLFEKRYLSKFTENADRNRNLIKIFANEIAVREAFLAPEIVRFLKSLMIHPVITGPVVSHWTSLDKTGQGFGLPYHQDWPSMATSAKSVICWMPLTDVSEETHGLAVIPGSHIGGALKGEQTAEGYFIHTDGTEPEHLVRVRGGQAVFMSAWLAHKTYVNQQCSPHDFKLSLSLRFDDLEEDSWDRRDFVSAYGTTVDRELWKS